MKHFRYYKAGEPDVFVSCEGDEPEGYPDYEFEEVDRLPGFMEYWEDGQWKCHAERLDVIYHTKIDYEAGEFRKNFITDVPGQQATYMEKERQAHEFKDHGNPALVPMIAAEAQVRGITPDEMADMVITIAIQWQGLSALIEARRIQAKNAVTAAPDEQSKMLAAVVNWGALIQ